MEEAVGVEMVEGMDELNYPLRCHLTLYSLPNSVKYHFFEVLAYLEVCPLTACPEDASVDILGEGVELFENVVMRKLLQPLQ